MDWFEHALRDSPYLFGAIACVVTFVFLRVVQRIGRSQPVRTATNLVSVAGFGMIAAFKLMRIWPPTLVQSEILVATILAFFLSGLALSHLGSITFDTATREFLFKGSVLGSALTALFVGVIAASLPLVPNNSFGDCAAWVAVSAWTAGGALDQWRRVVRAGGA